MLRKSRFLDSLPETSASDSH